MYLNSREQSVEIVNPGGIRRGDALRVYFEHVDKAGVQEPLRATFRSAIGRADWRLESDWFILDTSFIATDTRVKERLYARAVDCRNTLPWWKRLDRRPDAVDVWAICDLDFAIRPSFNPDAYHRADQSRRGILAIGWWLEVVPIIDGEHIVPLPSSMFRIPWTVTDIEIAKRQQ